MTEKCGQMTGLGFYGGTAGALAPFALFLAGVGWLGWSGAPDERGFWPILIFALVLGLCLARDRRLYADTAIQGMSRPIVMLMIMAWLTAGILATLLKTTGFVDGLVWLAASAGVTGSGFTVSAFAICCAVSTATGTSLGTLILCGPLLYPAAGTLGADPAFLMGAILAGATFGDNISPVSDTTIASATTQDAEMGGVVKSRMRYALPAAAVAIFVFVLFGGSAEPASQASGATGSARGLIMGLSPALVILLLLRGRHLLEGLFFGVLAALGLGFVFGLVTPNQVIYIDAENYVAKGLIVDGIEKGIGISVFTILIMGLTAGLEKSGVLGRLIGFAEKSVHSVRGAELWIFGMVSAAVLLTTHAVVAILTVGEFTRATGARFGIDRFRRSNLLDVTVSTYPFLLPYFIPTILAAGLTVSGTDHGLPRLSPWQIGWHNVHSWALLAIVLLAVITGFGRGSREDGA